MSPAGKIPVLLVDDEPQVLEGLVPHLRKGFEAVTAGSGAEGLRLLSENPRRFAVVVSDMRMPQMDGAEFLAEARKVAPDTTRMLLTGHAELDAAIAAINEGHVFRFLTKPCPATVLVPAIQAGVEQHQLVTAQRALLRDTFAGSIAVLTSLLELAEPSAFSRAGRVTRRAGELASRTGHEAWELRIAAQLSQIAAVTLPLSVRSRLNAGSEIEGKNLHSVRSLPRIAADLLARIPRLERVTEILRGAAQDPGTPGLLWESRALAALLDLDLIEQRGVPTARALVRLRRERAFRDSDILQEIESMLGEQAARSRIEEIELHEVRPGMVLAQDVRDPAGSLLLATGYEVTEALLQRLRQSLTSAGVTARLKVETAEAPEAAN